MLYIQKLVIALVACKINGNDSELQSILHNGDVVDIITSKNKSPSLHWIPITKTGKARSAIRKYWYKKGEEKAQRIKNIILLYGFLYLINLEN